MILFDSTQLLRFCGHLAIGVPLPQSVQVQKHSQLTGSGANVPIEFAITSQC